MKYFIYCMKNHSFAGRAGLSEYWNFWLFSFIFSFFLSVTSFITLLFPLTTTNNGLGIIILGFILIYLIFILINSIANIAVTVRRLHDQNKSGAWWFISLVPIIGSFILFILMLMPGTNGPNQFGDYPNQF